MRDGKRLAANVVAGIITLLLAAFFAFVGYMKATAPVAMLAQYGAWTAHVSEPVGRLVGWSEIACALLLMAGIAPRLRRYAAASAGVLILNQCVAGAVHAARGETGALPQNVLIIALCAAIVLLRRR